MGENSIINIRESRVNDWESERLSVVDDFSGAPKRRGCIIDCRRIDTEPVPKFVTSAVLGLRDDSAVAEKSECGKIDASAGGTNERTVFASRDGGNVVGGKGEAEESKREDKAESTENKEEETKRLKKYRTVASRSRVFPSSTPSSCPRLIQRSFLLFLSLLGVPFPSPFFSSQQFSPTGSRGPVLISGSFFALVSLLVVVLLHPTMAIPTVASVASDGSASGGTGTSTPNPRLNETIATLARTIQRSKNLVVVIGHEKKEASADGGMNFQSVPPTTMPIRRRRNIEHTSRQLSNEEEKEEEDDDQDEEDAFPALLIPHTWESAHEMRSQLREAELDTIRRSIVEGLGLERIPDPSKANVSQAEYHRAHQEYLTRLQHSRNSDDGSQRRLHTFHPAERNSSSTSVNRTRRSIPSEPRRGPGEISCSKGTCAYHFAISIPEDDSLIDHANLRFLLDLTGTRMEISKHAISLYRIAAGNSREFVSRQSFSNYENNGPRWIELDATELVNRWLEENTKDFGVELILESLQTGLSSGANEKKGVLNEPALNVFTMNYPPNQDSRGIRRKRRANPEHLMSIHKGRRTECRGENKKCCRHEMTVTFKDLKGFEFIVQPKNFDAGFCKGRCPPRYNPAHHHALLQSLIWKEDRRKAPRPCCAPSKLEELEILYFDENDPTKLKISSWKNMKVLECACS